MSAPPGIELVWYSFLAVCVLAAVAVAYFVARLLRKLLKVMIGPVEIIMIAAVFLLSFSASSLVLRYKEEVTIHPYGSMTSYEGEMLYYGFPTTLYRKFEPYDPAFKHLFTTPSVPNLVDFFIYFAFWMAISVILVSSAKYLLQKHAGA